MLFTALLKLTAVLSTGTSTACAATEIGMAQTRGTNSPRGQSVHHHLFMTWWEDVPLKQSRNISCKWSVLRIHVNDSQGKINKTLNPYS
jgi:hypothetical protein